VEVQFDAIEGKLDVFGLQKEIEQSEVSKTLSALPHFKLILSSATEKSMQLN
jgi:hypothetical protein